MYISLEYINSSAACIFNTQTYNSLAGMSALTLVDIEACKAEGGVRLSGPMINGYFVLLGLKGLKQVAVFGIIRHEVKHISKKLYTLNIRLFRYKCSIVCRIIQYSMQQATVTCKVKLFIAINHN